MGALKESRLPKLRIRLRGRRRSLSRFRRELAILKVRHLSMRTCLMGLVLRFRDTTPSNEASSQ